MRVHVGIDARHFSALFDDLPDALSGEFSAAHGEENFTAGFFADMFRTFVVEVIA